MADLIHNIRGRGRDVPSRLGCHRDAPEASRTIPESAVDSFPWRGKAALVWLSASSQHGPRVARAGPLLNRRSVSAEVNSRVFTLGCLP